MSACKVKPVTAPENALGEPVLGGTGTNDQRVFAELDKDGQNILITFNDLKVQAGGDAGFFARSNLSLAVPVFVPENRALAFKARKVTGMAKLADKNSVATLSVETFFAGESNEASKEDLSGPIEQNFSHLPPMPQNVKFSPCGQDVTLRMNLSLLVRSRNKDMPSVVSLQTLGDETGAFDIQWVSCK